MRGWGIDARHTRRGRRWQKSLARHTDDEPPGHALGGSRGGFGSKFHLVADGVGTPLAVEVSAEQVHESTCAESVVGQAVACPIGRRRKGRRHRHKPKKIAGDKAYRFLRVRDWIKSQKVTPVIPHQDNERARWDPTVRFD